ncbi:MAG TPA: hypothetical protein ENJ35_06485 [Gammaproteobacteria bacterium]|nr:hypothetical protein [Gammaproteobacteria bacterium]
MNSTNRKKGQPASLQRQSGIVLMASLIMLVVMTLLVTSMMGNVTLQEKVSGNLRSKIRTFEVANSAVKRQWTWDGIINDLTGSETALDARTRNYDTDYADTNGDGTADINMPVKISICYAGEAPAAGLGLNANIAANNQTAVYHQFKVAGQALLPNHNAVSQIQVGGFLVLPKANIAANCAF